MAERNGEDECDATSSVGEMNTVFIDSNLDTHLAMSVSDSDTVLHLKKNIMNQHPESFPELGKIKINALKVKRRGLFYHLSDSMLVKSAFEGAKKCWFLSVDVSTVMQPNEIQMPNFPVASNQLALIRDTKTTSGDSSNHLAKNSSNKVFNNFGPGNSCNEVQKDLEMQAKIVTADDCSRVCSDFNGGLDYTRKVQEQPSDGHVILETNSKDKGGDSQVGVNDDHCNNPLEGSIRNEPGVGKKRKSKKKDRAEVSNFPAKNDDVDIDEHSSGKTCPLIPKDTKMENVNASNIVSEANVNYKDADSQVGVDHQCNNLIGGSLRSGFDAIKKHKSKKKTEDLVLNRTVKDDDIDIDKHSSDKTVREAPDDMEMVNTDVVKGPCSTSLDDTNLRIFKTPIAIQTRDDKSKKVCDAPPKDASNSIPASKKRKRRESKEADSHQEEDNNGISIVNQKNTTGSIENLITETPKVVNLVADTITQISRKKKKRSSRDQEVFVAPPSSQNVGEERCKENVVTVTMNIDKENVENVTNDVDKASDSTFVSNSNVQLARPYSAVGGDILGHDVANASVKNAVPGLGPESGLKATKKSKKHRSSNLNVLPPRAVTELGSMKENVVLSGVEDFERDDDGINCSDKVKEQRESPYNRGTEEMVLEKCGQTIQSEIDGQPKMTVGSANLAETNINLEALKSASSRKLKKKAKKPVSEKAIVSRAEYSANENVDAVKMCSPLSHTKIPEPTSLNTSLVEANNEGGNNRLSKSEEESLESEEFVQKNYGNEAEAGSRIQEKETKMDVTRGKITPKSTGVSAAKPRKKIRSERESQENEVIVQKINEKETEMDSQIKEKENKMVFAQQNLTDITPKDTEISAAKPRKKMKKIQTSTGETHPASPIKKQKLGAEEFFSSSNGNKEDENASKTEKLGKSSSKKLSTGKKLEPKKNIADGHGSLTSTADLTQATSSDTHKGNSIERPIDHVDGDVLNSPNVSDTNHQVDFTKRKEDEINFKEYFSPPIIDHETPAVNVVQKLQSSDMAVKSVKSKKSTKVSLEKGNERKSHPKKSTDFEHKDANRSTLRAKKELEQKFSLGNNRSTVVKSSSKKMGEVVNGSRREKSLLATPASIFQDQSSESSEDSDTSTKAPSDNSSSSSDSEEEGADSARRADFERNKQEPKTPYSQRIDMDVILRRSSRYKQAKLSAIPSQLNDTESQPVDFVPDSQPNQ